MSGLLPRTQDTQNQGSFENLTASNLIVNTSAFIQSLFAGTFNVSSILTSLISGNPNLNISATSATVNNDDILTKSANQAPTNKTIDSGSNTINITSAPLVSSNINNLINQDLRKAADAQFNTLYLTRSISGSTLMINQTFGNDNFIYFTAGGAPGGSFGNDFATSSLYMNSFGKLSFRTNSIEKLSIPFTGIPSGSTSNNLLCLNGTQLEYRSISSLPNQFDQLLNTTNAPSFTGLTINSPGTIGINVTTPSGGQPGIALNSTGNTYINFNAASSTRLQVGASTVALKSTIYSSGSYPLSLGTAGTERLLIPVTGIPLDNTATRLLCLDGTSGTTLEYRDVSSIITANPFNQSLNTTDNVSFNSVSTPTINGNPILSVNASSTIALQTPEILCDGTLMLGSLSGPGTLFQRVNGSTACTQTPVRGTIPASGSVSIFSFTVSSNACVIVYFMGGAKGNTVPTEGWGDYDYSFKIFNNAGVLDITAGVNSNKSERNGPTGGFGGKLSFTCSASGITASLNIANSGTFTCAYGGLCELRYAYL